MLEAIVENLTSVDTAPHGSVLSGKQFAEDIVKEISRAAFRVYIKTMAFWSGEYVDDICEAMAKRAHDIDVRLWYDDYSSHLTDIKNRGGVLNLLFDNMIYLGSQDHSNLFFHITANISKKLFRITDALLEDYILHKQHNQQQRERLRDNGVVLEITEPIKGISRLFPLLGRNHIKVYIVDNIAYVGGINLIPSQFQIEDIVVKLTDYKVVNALCSILTDTMYENTDTHNIVNPQYSIMTDAGKKGRSICVDHACNLIQSSQQRVVAVSKFPPTGKILKSLSGAVNRNVDVASIVDQSDANYLKIATSR